MSAIMTGGLFGCSAVQYEPPYVAGPIVVRLEELPKRPVPETGSVVSVPAGSSKAVLLGSLVAALLPTERDIQLALAKFNDPVGATIQDMDFASLLRQDLQAEMEAVGLTTGAGTAQRGASNSRDAEPLQTRVSIAHGLVENEPPAFAPKFVARIVFTPPPPRKQVEQKFVFYGYEHGFSSDALNKMASWWTTNGRYRAFVRHAAKAIAKQMVYSVYRDPAQRSQQAWNQMMATLGSYKASDLTSDSCAFDGEERVVYAVQRRLTSVAIAAVCRPDSPFLSGFVQSDMEWVLM